MTAIFIATYGPKHRRPIRNRSVDLGMHRDLICRRDTVFDSLRPETLREGRAAKASGDHECLVRLCRRVNLHPSILRVEGYVS